MATDPTKEQAAAREEVMKSEQEIQSIKTALRKLGASSSEDGQKSNSMEIVILKVEGLPESAKPVFSLQLSNPIEDVTLDKVFDPLNNNPAPEGSVAVFEGVETAIATLTVTAKDAGIPLGSSLSHDVAPLCLLDALDMKEKYVTELPVAIVAKGSAPATAESTTEEKSDAAVDAVVVEEINKTEEAAASAEAELVQPICTATLRVTFKPSPKDQKEELYELLNKTSRRKAEALETLRKVSTQLARSGDASRTTTSTAVTKPSVKPGFLNKKKKESTKLQKFYERTIGPNSLARKGFGVMMAGKNYLIFFGSIAFFHFQGQMLALPPPV